MFLSTYYQNRQPSAIRSAQITYLKRENPPLAINVAIGNVSLPMHPAMQQRLKTITSDGSPFATGVVQYTPSAGMKEAQETFLHLITSSGLSTDGLQVVMTDGGSQAMELMLLGVCGDDRPVLVIDPVYPNYLSFAARVGRKIITIPRTIDETGVYHLPHYEEIRRVIVESNASALLVIPYDNPTGQFISAEELQNLAKLCVEQDMWLISDEAYRELYYVDGEVSSVWGLSEEDVPGITGRRVSIESVSKVFNACGLRVGALITDNQELFEKVVAEYTANLCSNALGQYVFASLQKETEEQLRVWYAKQRAYYIEMMREVTMGLEKEVPGIIVSRPHSSLYSVVDVKNVVGETFSATDFVQYCAEKGSVTIEGKAYTLLVSPMDGFYASPTPDSRTQMRIAYVETKNHLNLVPKVLGELLKKYLESKQKDNAKNTN